MKNMLCIVSNYTLKTKQAVRNDRNFNITGKNYPPLVVKMEKQCSFCLVKAFFV